MLIEDWDIHLEVPVNISEPEASTFDIPATRSGCRHRFPGKRYADFLPAKASGLPQFISNPPSTVEPAPPHDPSPAIAEPDVPAPRSQSIQTEPNKFGLFRVYPTIPSSNPDDIVSLDSLCDSPNFATAPEAVRTPSSTFGVSTVTDAVSNVFAPFLNMTVFRLMNWFYGGSQMKSLAELDKLVNNVLLQDDFDKAHLEGFRAAVENQRLDAYNATKNADGTFSSVDGWCEQSVKIRLPAEKVMFTKEEDAPLFEVPGLFRRNIVAVIESIYQGKSFFKMNTMPYREYVQKSPNKPPERVWGEAYTANAHYEFHEEVQNIPWAPGDTMEHVIAGIQIWSDLTHLANFGMASLWPTYMYLSNQSKYT